MELKGRLAAARLEPLGRSGSEQTFAVELESSRGWSVRGHLRVPTGAGPEPKPAVVILGGIGTGRKAADLVHPREPHVILGLDYPWEGSRRPDLGEIVTSLPDVRRSVLLTPSALLLAADYLAGRPDVRDDDLMMIGASFGVPFVTTAAALDERAHTSLPIYGGGNYRELIRSNLKRRSPSAPAWVADLAAWIVEPVEPLQYVERIAPRWVVMVNGLRDDRIPRETVYALFAAAREPKTLVWLDTPHITPRDDALLQAIADTAIRILESPSRPRRPRRPRRRSGTDFTAVNAAGGVARADGGHYHRGEAPHSTPDCIIERCLLEPFPHPVAGRLSRWPGRRAERMSTPSLTMSSPSQRPRRRTAVRMLERTARAPSRGKPEHGGAGRSGGFGRRRR